MSPWSAGMADEYCGLYSLPTSTCHTVPSCAVHTRSSTSGCPAPRRTGPVPGGSEKGLESARCPPPWPPGPSLAVPTPQSLRQSLRSLWHRTLSVRLVLQQLLLLSLGGGSSRRVPPASQQHQKHHETPTAPTAPTTPPARAWPCRQRQPGSPHSHVWPGTVGLPGRSIVCQGSHCPARGLEEGRRPGRKEALLVSARILALDARAKVRRRQAFGELNHNGGSASVDSTAWR